MNDFFQSSVFFGAAVTLISYGIGVRLKRSVRSPLCNPLLISILLTAAFLLAFRIDYDVYYAGTKYVSYLLTPATICLAVPLYEQLELLKKYAAAIFIGIGTGVATSLCCVLLLSWLFGLEHLSYVTLLPKSITTAIGIGISEELGGHVSLTVAVIIITGILGSISAEAALRLFRITSPVAKGVAIGTASHAIGTAKAMELGEVEGAMSSLSIVVSGLLTVVGASLFSDFL